MSDWHFVRGGIMSLVAAWAVATGWRKYPSAFARACVCGSSGALVVIAFARPGLLPTWLELTIAIAGVSLGIGGAIALRFQDRRREKRRTPGHGG